MALMPKRVKYRKNQRGRIRGEATRGNTVSFGDFGLQSLQPGYVKATTLEACRVAAMQYIRGDGKLYIRLFPHKPCTARPLETRMGTGKGEPDHWVAVVKKGTIMFEVAGLQHDAARECFARVAYKLPLKVRMVGRRPGE